MPRTELLPDVKVISSFLGKPGEADSSLVILRKDSGSCAPRDFHMVGGKFEFSIVCLFYKKLRFESEQIITYRAASEDSGVYS